MNASDEPMPGLFHSGRNQASPVATSSSPARRSPATRRRVRRRERPAGGEQGGGAERRVAREPVAGLVACQPQRETPTAIPTAEVASAPSARRMRQSSQLRVSLPIRGFPRSGKALTRRTQSAAAAPTQGPAARRSFGPIYRCGLAAGTRGLTDGTQVLDGRAPRSRGSPGCERGAAAGARGRSMRRRPDRGVLRNAPGRNRRGAGRRHDQARPGDVRGRDHDRQEREPRRQVRWQRAPCKVAAR